MMLKVTPGRQLTIVRIRRPFSVASVIVIVTLTAMMGSLFAGEILPSFCKSAPITTDTHLHPHSSRRCDGGFPFSSSIGVTYASALITCGDAFASSTLVTPSGAPMQVFEDFSTSAGCTITGGTGGGSSSQSAAETIPNSLDAVVFYVGGARPPGSAPISPTPTDPHGVSAETIYFSNTLFTNVQIAVNTTRFISIVDSSSSSVGVVAAEAPPLLFTMTNCTFSAPSRRLYQSYGIAFLGRELPIGSRITFIRNEFVFENLLHTGPGYTTFTVMDFLVFQWAHNQTLLIEDCDFRLKSRFSLVSSSSAGGGPSLQGVVSAVSMHILSGFAPTTTLPVAEQKIVLNTSSYFDSDSEIDAVLLSAFPDVSRSSGGRGLVSMTPFNIITLHRNSFSSELLNDNSAISADTTDNGARQPSFSAAFFYSVAPIEIAVTIPSPPVPSPSSSSQSPPRFVASTSAAFRMELNSISVIAPTAVFTDSSGTTLPTITPISIFAVGALSRLSGGSSASVAATAPALSLRTVYPVNTSSYRVVVVGGGRGELFDASSSSSSSSLGEGGGGGGGFIMTGNTAVFNNTAVAAMLYVEAGSSASSATATTVSEVSVTVGPSSASSTSSSFPPLCVYLNTTTTSSSSSSSSSSASSAAAIASLSLVGNAMTHSLLSGWTGASSRAAVLFLDKVGLTLKGGVMGERRLLWGPSPSSSSSNPDGVTIADLLSEASNSDPPLSSSTTTTSSSSEHRSSSGSGSGSSALRHLALLHIASCKVTSRNDGLDQSVKSETVGAIVLALQLLNGAELVSTASSGGTEVERVVVASVTTPAVVNSSSSSSESDDVFIFLRQPAPLLSVFQNAVLSLGVTTGTPSARLPSGESPTMAWRGIFLLYATAMGVRCEGNGGNSEGTVLKEILYRGGGGGGRIIGGSSLPASADEAAVFGTDSGVTFSSASPSDLQNTVGVLARVPYATVAFVQNTVTIRSLRATGTQNTGADLKASSLTFFANPTTTGGKIASTSFTNGAVIAIDGDAFHCETRGLFQLVVNWFASDSVTMTISGLGSGIFIRNGNISVVARTVGGASMMGPFDLSRWYSGTIEVIGFSVSFAARLTFSGGGRLMMDRNTVTKDSSLLDDTMFALVAVSVYTDLTLSGPLSAINITRNHMTNKVGGAPATTSLKEFFVLFYYYGTNLLLQSSSGSVGFYGNVLHLRSIGVGDGIAGEAAEAGVPNTNVPTTKVLVGGFEMYAPPATIQIQQGSVMAFEGNRFFSGGNSGSSSYSSSSSSTLTAIDLVSQSLQGIRLLGIQNTAVTYAPPSVGPVGYTLPLFGGGDQHGVGSGSDTLLSLPQLSDVSVSVYPAIIVTGNQLSVFGTDGALSTAIASATTPSMVLVGGSSSQLTPSPRRENTNSNDYIGNVLFGFCRNTLNHNLLVSVESSPSLRGATDEMTKTLIVATKMSNCFTATRSISLGAPRTESRYTLTDAITISDRVTLSIPPPPPRTATETASVVATASRGTQSRSASHSIQRGCPRVCSDFVVGGATASSSPSSTSPSTVGACPLSSAGSSGGSGGIPYATWGEGRNISVVVGDTGGGGGNAPSSPTNDPIIASLLARLVVETVPPSVTTTPPTVIGTTAVPSGGGSSSNNSTAAAIFSPVAYRITVPFMWPKSLFAAGGLPMNVRGGSGSSGATPANNASSSEEEEEVFATDDGTFVYRFLSYSSPPSSSSSDLLNMYVNASFAVAYGTQKAFEANQNVQISLRFGCEPMGGGTDAGSDDGYISLSAVLLPSPIPPPDPPFQPAPSLSDAVGDAAGVISVIGGILGGGGTVASDMQTLALLSMSSCASAVTAAGTTDGTSDDGTPDKDANTNNGSSNSSGTTVNNNTTTTTTAYVPNAKTTGLALRLLAPTALYNSCEGAILGNFALIGVLGVVHLGVALVIGCAKGTQRVEYLNNNNSKYSSNNPSAAASAAAGAFGGEELHQMPATNCNSNGANGRKLGRDGSGGARDDESFSSLLTDRWLPAPPPPKQRMLSGAGGRSLNVGAAVEGGATNDANGDFVNERYPIEGGQGGNDAVVVRFGTSYVMTPTRFPIRRWWVVGMEAARYPSISFAVLLFLQNGFFLCGFEVARTGGDGGADDPKYYLGYIAIIWVIVPILLSFFVASHLASRAFYPLIYRLPQPWGFLGKFVLPIGQLDKNVIGAEMFNGIIGSFRFPQWYLVSCNFFSFAAAAPITIGLGASCEGLYGFSVGLHFVFAAILMVVRPFRVRLQNILQPICLVVNGLITMHYMLMLDANLSEISSGLNASLNVIAVIQTIFSTARVVQTVVIQLFNFSASRCYPSLRPYEMSCAWEVANWGPSYDDDDDDSGDDDDGDNGEMAQLKTKKKRKGEEKSTHRRRRSRRGTVSRFEGVFSNSSNSGAAKGCGVFELEELFGEGQGDGEEEVGRYPPPHYTAAMTPHAKRRKKASSSAADADAEEGTDFDDVDDLNILDSFSQALGPFDYNNSTAAAPAAAVGGGRSMMAFLSTPPPHTQRYDSNGDGDDHYASAIIISNSNNSRPHGNMGVLPHILASSGGGGGGGSSSSDVFFGAGAAASNSVSPNKIRPLLRRGSSGSSYHNTHHHHHHQHDDAFPLPRTAIGSTPPPLSLALPVSSEGAGAPSAASSAPSLPLPRRVSNARSTHCGDDGASGMLVAGDRDRDSGGGCCFGVSNGNNDNNSSGYFGGASSTGGSGSYAYDPLAAGGRGSDADAAGGGLSNSPSVATVTIMVPASRPPAGGDAAVPPASSHNASPPLPPPSTHPPPPPLSLEEIAEI